MEHSDHPNMPRSKSTAPPPPPPRSPVIGPQVQHPSKRDKRRTALQERLQELNDSFSNSRDVIFRQQIHTLQVEMALIAGAQPYGPEPLADAPDELGNLVEQISSLGQLSPDPALAGKWYNKFVQEINQAKEERDAELAALMNRHRLELKRIKREHDFRAQQAIEESKILKATVRERLIQSITSRKAHLMREKEQLDVQDTNALLLHPDRFSAGNPASPGAHAGSRKTRHTARLNYFDAISGLTLESGKRKRKAVGDDDTGASSQDDHFTPGERMKLRLAEQQHGPVYSIDSIFSEKELSLAGNQAHVAAVHFFARSKRHKASNSNAETDEGSAGSEKEDAHAAAPEVEKTASQNVHVTRSTRANGGQVTLSLLGDGERSKERPNSPYFILSNYHAKPSGAGNAPPLPPLMPEEVDEDLAKIDKWASKPPSQVDSHLLDKLMEAIDDNDGLDPDTVNKFSMLHPDFPPTMDVHLVRLHPEKE